jgi:hypothetical protein
VVHTVHVASGAVGIAGVTITDGFNDNLAIIRPPELVIDLVDKVSGRQSHQDQPAGGASIKAARDQRAVFLIFTIAPEPWHAKGGLSCPAGEWESCIDQAGAGLGLARRSEPRRRISLGQRV